MTLATQDAIRCAGSSSSDADVSGAPGQRCVFAVSRGAHVPGVLDQPPPTGLVMVPEGGSSSSGDPARKGFPGGGGAAGGGA